ncbi:hypothetical protein [Methylocella tundrae]|jgi:hypothetical protein|uniref:Uncharacterized protein n=1 Tax=Methylocella tundrae TaxID=227605 RepID=A0A4U8YWI2_METTU|nr:hypothetical protein [Methylocella tundrae]WPP05033.1 hypothetical protein SIN04_04170 [Methylocella tundrae]VFU07330.1 exported protein of unknown function [Methylocella tundrae]
MTRSLLTLTLFSGLALGATTLYAQTPFPMSASPSEYSAPAIGVEPTAPLREGRSAFVAQRPGEISGAFDDFARPIDYKGYSSDQ